MTLTAIRNWSHDALAALGVLAGGQALIVNLIQVFGVSVSASKVSDFIGLAGAGVTLFSKAIDSHSFTTITAVASAAEAAANAPSSTAGATEPPKSTAPA